MENLSLLNAGLAFMFGLLSFLSPCVLPLLPGYFSFIAGSGGDQGTMPERRRLVWNSTGFVLGFGVLFVGMGAAASGLGQWLNQNREMLTQIAGVIIIILGLHVSGLLPVKMLYRQVSWQPGRKLSGWPGAFVLGLSFAAAWTPCVGPVLASILLLAGSFETMTQGVILLTFFTMGLALPFMLAAFAAGFVYPALAKMRGVMPYINAVSGGLLIAMGVLLLFGIWDRLARVFY
ncbi:cytochrome c biogenesis CcdA family protein [Desulfoscipio geothermicus]|uniref:Cytochrome c-type biogenesis protein n=1 Tax=Desulfoscipio geothermicus DSM 3669 TaxID=1121426 RepID=A0A1I6E6C6_9FIRM|nr:cytochrome c biogenesis protein CcdA [Desulfoscipio geothermicus]SFR13299.1 cytochrome c-type biogenesis protein [Desulfoscipio geothermicus DSM 3669]